MEKPAPAEYPVADLIQQRWSPRAFSEKALPPETLRSLLEAARWAASANNTQPWSYLLANRADGVEYERMLSCLNASNQAWAKSAPLLLVSVVETVNPRNGRAMPTAWHDAGMANAQLFLQATHMGLAMHMMGGIDRDLIRETYQLPESCFAIAAIAIGHPGELDALPPETQAKDLAERVRRPQSDFVFTGTWGQSAFSGA